MASVRLDPALLSGYSEVALPCREGEDCVYVFSRLCCYVFRFCSRVWRVKGEVWWFVVRAAGSADSIRGE